MNNDIITSVSAITQSIKIAVNTYRHIPTKPFTLAGYPLSFMPRHALYLYLTQIYMCNFFRKRMTCRLTSAQTVI